MLISFMPWLMYFYKNKLSNTILMQCVTHHVLSCAKVISQFLNCPSIKCKERRRGALKMPEMHQNQALLSFKCCMQNSSKSLCGSTLLNFHFDLKTTYFLEKAFLLSIVDMTKGVEKSISIFLLVLAHSDKPHHLRGWIYPAENR